MRIPPNRPARRIAGRKVIGPKPSLIPPRSQRKTDARTKNAAPAAIPSRGRSRGSLRNACDILDTDFGPPRARILHRPAKDNWSRAVARFIRVARSTSDRALLRFPCAARAGLRLQTRDCDPTRSATARTDAAAESNVAGSFGNPAPSDSPRRAPAHWPAHSYRPATSAGRTASRRAADCARARRTRDVGERRRHLSRGRDSKAPSAGLRASSNRRTAPATGQSIREAGLRKHRKTEFPKRALCCPALGSRSEASRFAIFEKRAG